MLDFLKIAEKRKSNGVIEVEPKFPVRKCKDLMIRGGDFYAFWNEEDGCWSTDEDELTLAVDNKLTSYANELRSKSDNPIIINYMQDCDSGAIDKWRKYCNKQRRDDFKLLDSKLIFANDDKEKRKKYYSSRKLSYNLEEGKCDAWNELISTLYDEEERHKIEWCIGCIVAGDSVKIQKFAVFYGNGGTGKSTIINIIEKLFGGLQEHGGYCTYFDSKSLGNSSKSFALEPFKNNPLVGIQHDGKLSNIQDNTRLNSLISHEYQVFEEKYRSSYTARSYAFLFMGTNEPVKITDSRSGLIRRLIDIYPSGRLIPQDRYIELNEHINFELGAIAFHCKNVYESNKHYYDDYIPIKMMKATNDIYNFILENQIAFTENDGVSVKAAWEMYKMYVDEAKVQFPLPKKAFEEELKNYFSDFYEKTKVNGTTVYNWYSGFEIRKNANKSKDKLFNEAQKQLSWLIFEEKHSLLDDYMKDCYAQLANDEDKPFAAWDRVKTKLKDIDTKKVHYVLPNDIHHIVIDFDIKDESGKKSLEKNIKAALKFPPTYAELSKGGAGIHLHYLYSGDVDKLSSIYDEDIEVKVFKGKSSLRRRLSKCNDIPIATISSGLPLKEDIKKMIDSNTRTTEAGIITTIKRCLNREIHQSTIQNIQFIEHILNKAYDSGVSYDVTKFRPIIIAFASGKDIYGNNVHRPSDQFEECMRLISKMHFKSDIDAPAIVDTSKNKDVVIFDIEMFPNLLVICWKLLGPDKPVNTMINPTPQEVQYLIEHYDLIGFNNRKYDNHIIYARAYLGYDNAQLYKLNNLIINEKKGFIGSAYNISKTDIYDYCSPANKMGLKKWEFKLKIRHLELGIPWYEPVPLELFDKVAEYCCNDVKATEAVWNATQADYISREIMAYLVKALRGIDVSVNETTNNLSKMFVFGKNKHPQKVFNWRDMSKPVGSDQYEEYLEKFGHDYKFRVFNAEGLPEYRDYIPYETLPDGYSILPFFKGYVFDPMAPKGEKSTYLGAKIGEGGRVYADHGFHGNVDTEDVEGMHPATYVIEVMFGVEFTKIVDEVRQARLCLKHNDLETAAGLLGGVLKPYFKPELIKGLIGALKGMLNSIYGLTAASFENEFRNPNNIDNMGAKRGALFISLLKDQVEKQGYKVVHLKTDSIKIEDCDDNIRNFIRAFGREYGYNFETESSYNKMCLVNDAVYIAQDHEGKWHATGDQFKVPFVFKTLFSKEPIEFDDMCELKQVKGASIHLDMNEGKPDVSYYELLKQTRIKYENGKDLTKKETNLLIDNDNLTNEELDKKISEGHDYHFVGNVGQFTPIKPGKGGGLLLCYRNGKWDNVSGCSGYRWMESEMVRLLHKEDDIDISYYTSLCDKAKETISQYIDFEWFVSGDKYVTPIDIHSDKLPF